MDTLKQVLVLRRFPSLRKGKYVSQGAHASLLAFLDADKDVSRNWLASGQTKITVYVDSEDRLFEIHKLSKEANLPCSLVLDLGKTEFGGQQTYTAVGIGPAHSSLIDAITGDLPLL